MFHTGKKEHDWLDGHRAIIQNEIPGSQPSIKKMDDGKPLFKKWWFGNQPKTKKRLDFQFKYVLLDFIWMIPHPSNSGFFPV